MSIFGRTARALALLSALACFAACASDSSHWKCDKKTGFCSDVKAKKKHASASSHHSRAS